MCTTTLPVPIQYFIPSPFCLSYCATMIFRLIVLFILVLTTSKAFLYASPSNETDQHALLSFKAKITDDPLGALDSWNNSIHFCQWKGVTCSHRRQRVTAINLVNQNLRGTFSPHIGNLSFLRGFYLYNNSFHGQIPNEIGRLFRLQQLNLESNFFEGKFPTNLSHCVHLTNISIYDNKLEGKLPTEFASWPKLYLFALGKNYFTGSIPPSIGNLSLLHSLHLDHNNLVAGIPLEITHLANLELLALAVNNLSGTVPLALYNMSSLSTVSLTQNELEGTLPGDFGITLPQLKEVYIGENRFSGLFPPSIANASNLVIFEIWGNNITGPLPNNLGNLPNLEMLSLGQNLLGGGNTMQIDDWSFFDSLVNCTHLKYLSLNENGLRGQLPISIVNLSTTMEVLYMYRNQIYGGIPREIGKLVNMTTLSLFGNLLTGTIPESIGELSKLGTLDLSNNSISGVIPTSVSNMTQLFFLTLHGNMLQGSLPHELFTITTLQEMDLANNRLTGEIPVEIVFSYQIFILLLNQNQFAGPLPSNIGNLRHLVMLYVSENKLTGDIPATLGDCLMLEELGMGGNLFQGRIPTSFKALKSLRYLDLSMNNISGNTPSFFVGFHLMEYLNLSHNTLGGEVPSEGLFLNDSAFSIVGNSGLCGGIQALHLPTCPEKFPRNKKEKIGLRLVLLLVLVPTGILLACLALICHRRRNSKKVNEPHQNLKDKQYPKLSYQDLLLATNEFSPNNLLGEGRYGSVYRGVLESVEHILAVKVLKVGVHGAAKTFLAECETLRNIRHRNLIKIITACSSTDYKGNDFKALVFEFMTRGNVDSWLHPNPSDQGNERNLTLLQRLNIAIDVALGVDYLHHQSHARVIHCDIKPSNILLDEDFVAHIGDFGLARFSFVTSSDVNQAQMSSNGLRGTIGYIPPEYGMWGEISTEGDVYSYGIFLLEMFTGKRPTEWSILTDSGKNLYDYVRKALPQNVMAIADPRILLDQTYSWDTVELSLASIFEVGILCSEETPKNRIDISVAVKQLHATRDKLLQHSHQTGENLDISSPRSTANLYICMLNMSIWIFTLLM